jgi:hypothetical protein
MTEPKLLTEAEVERMFYYVSLDNIKAELRERGPYAGACRRYGIHGERCQSQRICLCQPTRRL